ncbi:MAG: exopolysaccharide biosynthesis polyprenyl glycosylphosphotransferase [Anaerolineae bacterium]|nr:exopolysaccharide biosynthesis polyprenyl glycosylphosphotransferase [Anaerolineae bacterium]
MSEKMWVQQNVEEPMTHNHALRKNWRLTAKDRRLLLFIVDLLLVNGMLLVSVALWNNLTSREVFSLGNVKWFITITVLWLVVGTVLDVYNLARASSTSSILASVISAAVLSTLLFLAIPVVSPPVFRRSYAFGLVGLMTVTLTGWRVFYAYALGHTAFRQLGIVVGGDVPVAVLKQMLHQTAESNDANPFRGTGYEVVGRVVDRSHREVNDELPVLGETQNLVRLARQYGVDEIILNLEEGQGFPLESQEILLDCRELGLRVSSLASVYERLTGRLPVDYARYDSQLLLSPPDTPAFRLYQATKRVLDVLIGLLGLLVLGLLIPLVSLANALTSPGPLFYRQERLGKGGRPFTVIKLRSMVRDAERYGAVWCGKNDPRITPIGRFMRKVRLDEVPQFINVLRGQMSFVGPRPERPHFVGELARAFPLYRARHAVKPGLTGWAQVHHEYGDSTEDARIKLELDLYYVKHAGFYLDLLTVLHTVRVIIGFKGQ